MNYIHLWYKNGPLGEPLYGGVYTDWRFLLSLLPLSLMGHRLTIQPQSIGDTRVTLHL